MISMVDGRWLIVLFMRVDYICVIYLIYLHSFHATNIDMGVRVHRFDMSTLSMRAVSQQQQQSIGNNNSTTYLHLSCDALGDTVVKVNLFVVD
jgi:hypothetical protein